MDLTVDERWTVNLPQRRKERNEQTKKERKKVEMCQRAASYCAA